MNAAMIIINLYVRNESHDFYKSIACLIIKISVIGIKISEFVFLKVMVFITLQSIGENEYGKTGQSKIFTFLRHV